MKCEWREGMNGAGLPMLPMWRPGARMELCVCGSSVNLTLLEN